MSLTKYTERGQYSPVFYCCKSEDDSVTKYQIYYPKELQKTPKKFPVIVIVNGIYEPSYLYRHVFEHLASWGFIVIGNYDIDSWSGYSTLANLKFLLQLNNTENNIFYQKVDMENIGLLGHSEGGVGAINAATKYKDSHYFKAIYTASIPSLLVTRFMGWNYDVSLLKIPYCMVQGTEILDSRIISPHYSGKNNYNKTPDEICKILARYDKGTHNGMLWEVWEAYTAWFMWHLQKDKNAEKIFAGKDAKILLDWNWRDIRKNF